MTNWWSGCEPIAAKARASEISPPFSHLWSPLGLDVWALPPCRHRRSGRTCSSAASATAIGWSNTPPARRPVLGQEGEIGGDGDVGLVAMGDDALAARPGKLGDAHELGQTAGHRHVGLGDIDLADVEHRRVFETRRQPEIAGADRDAEALETGMTGEVVDRKGRFDPREAMVPEERHQGKAFLGRRPGGRRIDHQPDVRAHMLARGVDQSFGPGQIVAPERIGHDLDRLQPELQAAIDRPADLIGRFSQRIDRAIREHPVAPPRPEQIGRRLAGNLAANVPQGDVDGAQGVDDHAAAAVIAGEVVHPVPESLDVGSILADQSAPSIPSHGCASAARR